MVKWMLGLAILAVVAAIAAMNFGVPAAGTVSIISFAIAGLLFVSRIFERTASA